MCAAMKVGRVCVCVCVLLCVCLCVSVVRFSCEVGWIGDWAERAVACVQPCR